MAIAPPPMEEVDFVVLSEDYSRFLVHDGTIIKAKMVVRKIFFASQKSPEGYPVAVSLDSMNAIAAIVPQTNKRAPSMEQFDPTRERGEEQKFEEQETKTQEYMTTTGFRITVKPIVTKVFKYKKYNNFGEPIYNVALQAITNIDKIASTAASP
jgi:hypothetical protein